MNQRIQKFLMAENISQSQFADSIGVARASVSHILSGRNKPGFDFIEKMSHSYPNLNLEWLITGKGRMYKSGFMSAEEDPNIDKNLFSAQEESVRESEFDAENGSLKDSLFDKSLAPLEKVYPQSPATDRKPESGLKSEPEAGISVIGAESVFKSVKQANKGKETSVRFASRDKTISKIIVFYSDSTFQEIK